MGGSRPMTWGRAASLGVLLAAVLGIATGLSHVGSTPVAKCHGTWRVVVGHPSERSATSTENSRATALVPTDCTESDTDPKGGYVAFALFDTEQEAQDYAQQLVAAGYAKLYGVEPSVEPAPATTNTIP